MPEQFLSEHKNSGSRRRFLQAGAAFTASSYSRILGANERVRIGGLGTGGRGRYLLGLVNKIGGADIVALCDVYEPRRMGVKERLAPDASVHVDYREVLDRKDIDAVVIGSPDHWHTPMTIDAVSAGKDVYVEKPVTHTIREGALLLNAVEGSGRIVQAGYQQRSWPHFQQAYEIVKSGGLGQITLILTYWYQNHLDEATSGEDRVDPSKLDWKKWLGSAPDQPFVARRYLSWRWFWDFGGGAMTDLFSHWVDVVHWFMGSDTPKLTQAMGERWAIKNLECPDTQNAYFEYPNFSVSYLGTLVCLHEGGGLVFRGSQAMLRLHRGGFDLYPEQTKYTEVPTTSRPAQEVKSTREGTEIHMENFLDCVRSRKQPNAPIPVAIAAARAGQIGNLAMRGGKIIRYPEDVPDNA